MKKKKKIKSNTGILFFITGLSGAGKSSLTKLIKPFIQRNYGKTIIISSEKLRKILSLTGFSQKDRENIGLNNIKLLKYLINQRVNIIYDAIGLREKLRKIKRRTFKNYIEIYIKTSVKRTYKLNKKPSVYKKNKINIVGIDIKAELPKKPDITVTNNFDKSLKKISLELQTKIKNKIKLIS